MQFLENNQPTSFPDHRYHYIICVIVKSGIDSKTNLPQKKTAPFSMRKCGKIRKLGYQRLGQRGVLTPKAQSDWSAVRGTGYARYDRVVQQYSSGVDGVETRRKYAVGLRRCTIERRYM